MIDNLTLGLQAFVGGVWADIDGLSYGMVVIVMGEVWADVYGLSYDMVVIVGGADVGSASVGYSFGWVGSVGSVGGSRILNEVLPFQQNNEQE